MLMLAETEALSKPVTMGDVLVFAGICAGILIIGGILVGILTAIGDAFKD